jgi:hypothetical protein
MAFPGTLAGPKTGAGDHLFIDVDFDLRCIGQMPLEDAELRATARCACACPATIKMDVSDNQDG